MPKKPTIKRSVTKTAAVAPKPINIKDKVVSANHGVILLSDKAMQEILINSGPLAKSNEFQVHYWFLNLRFRAADNSILDIAIPTVYFNYKQEVTSVHIDFDLKDVEAISEKLLPIHNSKVAEITNSNFISNLETKLNITFELSSVNFGSQHRHP